ncbi:MAG: hypothetical protein V4501_12250 [Pseudomonadota bacterium]
MDNVYNVYNALKAIWELLITFKNIQPYYVSVSVYSANQPVPSDCNAIAFVNDGTNPVNVFAKKLYSGNTLSIAGNSKEKDTTSYEVWFTDTGGTNQLTVIRKFYK